MYTKKKKKTGTNKCIMTVVLNSDGRKEDTDKPKAISCYSVEGKGHRTSSRVRGKIRKLRLAVYGERSMS